MIVDELVRESIIDSAVLQSIRSESIPSDEGFESLAVQVRSLPNSLSRIVQDLLRIFCLPTLRPSDGSSNFQDAGKGLRFPAPSVLCRIFDVVLKALDSRPDDSNSTSKDTGGEEQSRESAQEGQSLADSDDAKKQEVKRSLERAILNNVWSLCIEWEADGPSFGSAAAARGQAGKAEAPEWVRRMDEVHARCMGQLMVVVRALLDAGIITTSEAKIRLEPGFLERVGAIESARVLTAYATRLRTMALYKQDKFNLLQEESQGFAKVIATLGMSMLAFRRRVEEKEQAETRPATNGLPATDQKASPTRMETEPSEGVSLTSSERALWDIQNDTALINEVERLWESINFTIGTFDIDPNRVVDLILDFFIARVKQDWRFFIAVLLKSPLCKGYERAKLSAVAEESGESHTSGHTLAQLIGIKLQHYHKTTDDSSEPTDIDSVHMVAALLITHHLITLTDLYPYLSPDDAEMASEYEAWKAKLEDQAAGSSGTNLLAMMGSLEDLGVDEDALDSLDLDALISNATLSKSANSDSKSAVNQKALLCSHLFSLGNIPLALWFVRRFPFIPAINTNVADHLNHLLDIIVDPYYQHIRWHPFFVAGPEREQPRYRDYALTPSVGVLKQARHAGRDRRYLALTRAYPAYSFASNNSKFFYAEYAEDPAPPTPALEPSPTGFTALLPRIKPWLDVLGPRLARDPRLLTKLIRIGKACLNGCREGVRAAEDSRSPKTASQPLPTEGQNGGEGRMEIEAPEQPEVEGKLAAARTEEERVTQTWITALEKWIIPAYTQVSSSPGMASELWALLSKLPYQTRYGIYSRWRTHIYKSSVELKAAEKTAQREVRTLMRMLSTETVRDVSRKLCRFCHSNPLPCLRIVLDQICSYDNLIVLAVDALRYLTKLDTDVLTYLILETLDDSPKAAQRLRLKEDGINAAHWLQSLATFIGTYFRKYPIPQLRYIIEFLARRMTASVNSLPSLQPSPAAPSRGTDRSGFLVYEMIIFGELIQKMAVIESTSRPSDSQIKAMQGGPLLRLESHEMAGSFSTQCQNNILVRLGNKPTVQLPTHNSIRRAIKQLAHELLQAPLSRPLFLGLSIQAHYLLLPLHPSEGSPVPREDHPRRVLTIFYDRMMEMAGQFTQFARAYFTQNELEALIPSLAQLRRDYGLEWAACWHWARLYFSGSLANAITEWAKHQKIERTKSQDGDADNGNGKMPAENGGPHEGTSIPEKTTGETDASTDKTEEQADEATPHVSEPVTNAGDSSDAANLIPDDSVSQPIKELNREVVEFVKQHLPESDTLACFSADFYTLFWTLSISDIRVPKERYQQEIARLKAFCHSVEAALAQSSSKDREAEREFYRVRNLIPSMEKELADHEQHVKDVRAWLASYKRSLFNKPDAIVFAKAFFKYCIFPRAKFSPLDAVYCASMIELLQHPLGADNFPTLFVYNLIFDHPMHELLGSMTDNEARCYAKFLNQCLTTLDRWRITRYLFELEGRKNGKSAGFMCVITPTKGSQRLQSPSGPETKRPPPTRILEHEELRRIVFKWHIRLGESFTMCLASDDTQKIRNALLSMHELAQVFPAVKTIGQDLLGKLSKLIEQYKDNKNYDDLVTLARSYYSAISKNQENWSTQYEFSGIEQQQQPPPPPPQPSKLESSSQKRRHEREQRDSGRLSSHRREAHGTADIRADHERPLSASSTRESRHSSRDGRDRPRRQDRVDSRERLSSSNHYRSTGGVDDARGSSARDRREAAGGHSSRAERQPSSRRGDEVPSELDRAPNPHRESRQEWSRRDDREPAQPPPPPQKVTASSGSRDLGRQQPRQEAQTASTQQASTSRSSEQDRRREAERSSRDQDRHHSRHHYHRQDSRRSATPQSRTADKFQEGHAAEDMAKGSEDVAERQKQLRKQLLEKKSHGERTHLDERKHSDRQQREGEAQDSGRARKREGDEGPRNDGGSDRQSVEVIGRNTSRQPESEPLSKRPKDEHPAAAQESDKMAPSAQEGGDQQEQSSQRRINKDKTKRSILDRLGPVKPKSTPEQQQQQPESLSPAMATAVVAPKTPVDQPASAKSIKSGGLASSGWDHLSEIKWKGEEAMPQRQRQQQQQQQDRALSSHGTPTAKEGTYEPPPLPSHIQTPPLYESQVAKENSSEGKDADVEKSRNYGSKRRLGRRRGGGGGDDDDSVRGSSSGGHAEAASGNSEKGGGGAPSRSITIARRPATSGYSSPTSGGGGNRTVSVKGSGGGGGGKRDREGSHRERDSRREKRRRG